MTRGVENEKRFAAEAAAELVEDGMTVGLGTGQPSPTCYPLAKRRLSLRCVATSPQTEETARSLGIPVGSLTGLVVLILPSTAPTRSPPTVGW